MGPEGNKRLIDDVFKRIRIVKMIDQRIRAKKYRSPQPKQIAQPAKSVRQSLWDQYQTPSR